MKSIQLSRRGPVSPCPGFIPDAQTRHLFSAQRFFPLAGLPAFPDRQTSKWQIFHTA